MLRVHVICEGQTEEMFVNEVMAEAFLARDIYLYPSLLGKPGHKGGNVKFQRVLGDLKQHLLNDREAYCTTFFDFYGLHSEFPGKAQALALTELVAKNQVMKQAFSEQLEQDLGSDAARRFIPYIQFYEFEGLLFSDTEILAGESGHPELASIFQVIRDQFATPEHINNDPNTAPSKRITTLMKGYDKVSSGSLIALGIGFENIRRECPVFNEWIESLLALKDKQI